MYHFRPETWVKKHEDSFPKSWDTCNADYGKFNDARDVRAWKRKVRGLPPKGVAVETAAYYTSNAEYGRGSLKEWNPRPWLQDGSTQQVVYSHWKPHPGVSLPPLGEDRPLVNRRDPGWMRRKQLRVPAARSCEKLFDFYYRVPWKPSQHVRYV